jgi:hypothetical protein
LRMLVLKTVLSSLRKTLGKPPSISETEGVGTGITSLQYEAR